MVQTRGSWLVVRGSWLEPRTTSHEFLSSGPEHHVQGDAHTDNTELDHASAIVELHFEERPEAVKVPAVGQRRAGGDGRGGSTGGPHLDRGLTRGGRRAQDETNKQEQAGAVRGAAV